MTFAILLGLSLYLKVDGARNWGKKGEQSLGLWWQLLKNIPTVFILGLLLTGWHSQRDFQGDRAFKEFCASECSVVKFPSWEAKTRAKESSYEQTCGQAPK